MIPDIPLYIAQTLVFYWAFAAAITVYRKWVKGELNTYNKVLFAPLLIWFYLVDLWINWTVLFTVMGRSPAGTKTISERFEVYHAGGFGWKTDVATFVCEKLLNTIDPAGGHC